MRRFFKKVLVKILTKYKKMITITKINNNQKGGFMLERLKKTLEKGEEVAPQSEIEAIQLYLIYCISTYEKFKKWVFTEEEKRFKLNPVLAAYYSTMIFYVKDMEVSWYGMTGEMPPDELLGLFQINNFIEELIYLINEGIDGVEFRKEATSLYNRYPDLKKMGVNALIMLDIAEDKVNKEKVIIQ